MHSCLSCDLTKEGRSMHPYGDWGCWDCFPPHYSDYETNRASLFRVGKVKDQRSKQRRLAKSEGANKK